MRLLRTSLGGNFVVSVLLVLAWLAYAGWSGLPIDQNCMGFRRDWRYIKSPAWVAPLLIELIFLSFYAAWHYLNEPKIRFTIVAFSLWCLLFGIALPLLKQEVYGITFFTWDQPLWWYACVSNIAVGLVGSKTQS